MGQSTTQNQILERSQGESSSFFNFGDLFSAKIASLLQDFTGLPSTFSREKLTHGPWKKTENNQNMFNKDNKTSLQQDRKIIGDKAFEIPVKKYPGWVSSSTNSIPADAERRLGANQNNCNIKMPLNASLWQELVLGTQFSKADVEDYRRLWDHVANEHNSSDLNRKNNSQCLFLEMPSFISSQVTLMAREIFDRADFLSSQLFQGPFDPYFGLSKNLNVPGNPLSESSGVDTKNENIKNGILKSSSINNYETKSLRFETFPWSHREAEPVITNPFDRKICDDAETELDLYSFFSRCLSPMNQDREINVTNNRTTNLKKDLASYSQKLQCEIRLPFSSFTKEYTEIHESSLEDAGNPDRVVSSLSSSTQRLDHSGKLLHTSIQVTKTYGDGHSTSTTKDYIENIEEL
ncbi:hypothetical protein OnM2_017091 [Erysiphe neolycopersici]|uniref:Uncharacterized protein n=1 Tax=Erysiphe neolycopersici TaxID=212602 RepID=A0A420I4N3_9PEZI|nr:hypothetical protein OnM2_017091 [Erysiphe neolycopersici]